MATNETHAITPSCEEVRDNASGAVTDVYDYYWGKDLSGSFQGAGGVGGLLAYTHNGVLRIPVYDHIGNVVAVVDDAGAIVAAYEYDPFGNIVAQSGDEAVEVPFRFSAKYFDRKISPPVLPPPPGCEEAIGYRKKDFVWQRK